ncbi:MAG: hypothetical protein H0U76_18460 [Ktedonobacteraceae bacterium]|nr:hypothetical protein [Ktedonobacteraceae bacterium]
MSDTMDGSTLWGASASETARARANELQHIPGGPVGYRLRRIILTNFWLYDQMEFEIPHGRIFLAGENASGKSTVLIAAITMALDGDFRPERIDTFSKREKRIEYYIIGSDDSATPFTHERRTSYVALEFEWCDPDQPPFVSELRSYWERGEYERARFLTIGLAFSGNRNSAHPITPLRFLITDGSRLGHNKPYDIALLQETLGGPHVCDVRTFKKVVAEHGIVCEGQRDYEWRVAQALFNFTNVQDFRRLIKQLLYLRQPNLNSILSLEVVRTYLDESLPQIPGDLVQNAAQTIELMDDLRERVEQRRKAYTAAEHLHQAQVALTLSRSRLAACKYVHSHGKEHEAQNMVRQQKSNQTRAKNDLQRALERIQGLEQEQARIQGEIMALEASEELRAAQQLMQTTLRVQQLEESQQEQQIMLQNAQDLIELNVQRLESHRQEFHHSHQEGKQQIQELRSIAAQEALWHLAAEQLANVLQQVEHFSLEQDTPDISFQITTLQEMAIEERRTWLSRLRTLHQNLENEMRSLHNAQQRETQYYDELDEATRQFEQVREEFCQVLQDLADHLDMQVEQSEMLSPTHFTATHEHAIQMCNSALRPEEAVAQFTQLVLDYEQSIQRALKNIHVQVKQIQQRLDDLRQQRGAKELETRTAEQHYQQTLQEPEHVPTRSGHRREARELLATYSIPAYPLYMLLDFAPPIDGQEPEAGCIEYLLEDAGLLDALVVLPEHVETVDTLLAREGLSDCRLDLAHLGNGAIPGPKGLVETNAKLLKMDTALHAHREDASMQWQEVMQDILIVLHHTVLDTGETHEHDPSTIHWQHGLLTGLASPGRARCIGKETRLREQHNKQERARQQWERFVIELQTLDGQIEQHEQQSQKIKSLQHSLENALRTYHIDTHFRSLQEGKKTLDRVQIHYIQAHDETQECSHMCRTIRATLQRECKDMDIFMVDQEKVEQAYEQTGRLASEYKILYSRLGALLQTWKNYRQELPMYDTAYLAEQHAAVLHRRNMRELEGARAEQHLLKQLLESSTGLDAKELSERLEQLQKRRQTIPTDLVEASTGRGRAETHIVISQEELKRVQTYLEHCQQSREECYERFATLLISYPVELLREAQHQLTRETALETAKSLGGEVPLQEDMYLVWKRDLENGCNQARSALYNTFSEVANRLGEYGPQLDGEGNIRFLSVEQVGPFELLRLLGDEISQMERLLDDKERELFQDFLLKEMADIIKKYILDAETWVARLNNVLKATPFIDEQYQLAWVPFEPEQAQPGSYLAQYRTLLRKPVQAFKEEEIDAIVCAFRQEIKALHASRQEVESLPFAEELARVFDYRSWFRFEISVVSVDGQRRHLTNRTLKQRSGAEQYIALYVPFFAALSALYESAGKGAPRLIALDEAFEKVSVINTRRLLKFLASQQFQWIMTGPRVTGEGTEIPACVRYQMFHHKEAKFATGFPFFWTNM